MNITIVPSEINASVSAPPSKSLMQRACAAALLRGGRTLIRNYGQSGDDRAAVNIIRELGAGCEYLSASELEIRSHFPALRARQPGPQTSRLSPPGPSARHLSCGESGLSMRMFAPIAALLGDKITLTGSGSLAGRPMGFFDTVFPQLDVEIRSRRGKLPLEIRGPLRPKNISIDGNLSSQFLTGLLFAYSAAGAGGVCIRVKDLNSRPYIDLTLNVLKDFGMVTPENDNYEAFHFRHTDFPVATSPGQPGDMDYTIPGDWSNSAFLLTAGAIAGQVRVRDLDIFSAQADKKILEVLMDAGCGISIRNRAVEVTRTRLKAFYVDASNSPDLFPPLVALAAYCEGTSAIEGVRRLVHKESNRAGTLKSEFEKLGIEIAIREDTMLVRGGIVRGGKVNAHGDHRIAMACAIAALGAGGPVEIGNAEAVEKSYPAFFRDMKQAGMRYKQ